MNKILLPQRAWEGTSDLEISLPSEWQVAVSNMAGYNREALSSQEIKKAIQNPAGSLPIRSLASSQSQVVIIFDDIARSTRVAQIVPFVLEELAKAGVPDSNIRFIGATGCHAAMNRSDFVKKLGEEVVRRFRVYNHNPFGHCVKVGTTSLGVEVYANEEVVHCDVRIAIGTVIPHQAAGFSGGGKIILPGICSGETNIAFHRSGREFQQKNHGRNTLKGLVEGNPLRQNIREAVQMVGLNFKIEVLVNAHGETVAVYAGSPEEAFVAAVKDAAGHYLTNRLPEKDIIIAGAAVKVNEIEAGLDVACASVKQGGSVVLVGNAPEGHIPHYLFGSWGTLAGRAGHGSLQQVEHLYVMNEYPDLTVLDYFSAPEKVSIHTKWEEILEKLRKRYPAGAEVGVYPNADIQYFGEG
ncbi:MAG: lactate racemase domain-containing protein [Dehalococcoidales bacterium]|jgi:nickel-dependent lactate racemase|nr:lactate racemase domain-containing protein [Dehalococcoidales bacterium]